MKAISHKIRADFPVLQHQHAGKPLIYLDNACMTLKPKCVTDSMLDYYHGFPGCHGRTSHLFGADNAEL